ncbi:anti-anti-sigma factor (plasmid) [Streptomyces sp. SGAir0957]
MATVGTRSEGGVSVISVRGEVDYETNRPLRQALDEAGTAPVPNIVLDLSAVTFLDSTSLNLFLIARRHATEAGGWLRLAAPSAPVQRLLSIVGVDTVIGVYPTTAAALA